MTIQTGLSDIFVTAPGLCRIKTRMKPATKAVKKGEIFSMMRIAKKTIQTTIIVINIPVAVSLQSL